MTVQPSIFLVGPVREKLERFREGYILA